MSPDGLSYLDLAFEAVSGGSTKLLNGYWSPGYPALISIAFLLFRPSAGQEFPLIHFVNFLIFIFTLWAFSVFFRYWVIAPRGDEVVNEDKKSYLTPFAFSTFLWFTLSFSGTNLVTPDLAVAGFVFLAAAIGCRLSLPGSNWKHYVALGFVLGVAYYFKAAMFPLGAAFVALLFLLWPPPNYAARQKLLLTLSVFLLVATPLVATLSVRTNALTFGETARLNYLWFVNKLPQAGATDFYGIPEHPPRKLMERPAVIEFASPIAGTFPLWNDPSYWYAGAKVRFDLRQQMAALRQTLHLYEDIALDTMAFFSGAIVLCFFMLHEKQCPVVPRRSWWLLAWPLAAFSMYALVLVVPRYVSGFFVLFWLAIYRALMFRVNRQVAVTICAMVISTVMIPFTARTAMDAVRVASSLVHQTPPDYQRAALGLRDLGLQNGDRVAIVGNHPMDCYSYGYCYYARYARLRVVAAILDEKEFWHLSAPEWKSLVERLTSIGVKAVVASNRPQAAADWKDVRVSDETSLSAVLLSPSAGGRD